MTEPVTRPSGSERPMSVEDYLRFENASPLRHEYVAGEVYAMSGETKRHNAIVGSIYAHLRAAARAGPCRVFVEGVKMRAADDAIYYPDVMVECAPDDGSDLIAESPCLVVEVTSRSTARTDRGEKLKVYRANQSVQAYLIVAQDRRRVSRHWRGEDGNWRSEEHVEQGTIPVPCPETTLTLDAIYEDLTFPPRVSEPDEDWPADE